jgi:hypothetical protein
MAASGSTDTCRIFLVSQWNFRRNCSGQQCFGHVTTAASTAESAVSAKEIIKNLSELGVLRGEMHWLTV